MVDALVSDYAQVLQHLRIVVADDCFCSETVDGVPIRKLFISNLAERTTFKDLNNCFSVYGNVESCYLRRNQGKSNYAFVTFSNVDDALRAMEDGSRKEIRLHNRDLRVMPADSWHQPDSIEQQFSNTSKEWNKNSEKRFIDDQCIQECLQNDVESVSIHILNDDCLRHIFLFLPIVDRVRIERVCKRWRVLSQESWHTMKMLDLSPSTWGFSASIDIHTVTLRKVLLKCGKFLTRINLSEAPHCLSQSTLTIIGKLCPNLTNIDISALTVCASGIDTLANNCTSITKFSLGPSTFSCDKDLKNFFEVNQNLEYVAITRNSISGKCLSRLPEDTIHTTILDRCDHVQDNHLSIALRRLENLKHLRINQCIGIASRTLEAVGEHCQNLTILELCGDFPLAQAVDMLHLTHLVQLKVLKIVRNEKISDEFLANLALRCHQLNHIDITGCRAVSDTGLAAIATLSKLEKLIISHLDNVTDNGLHNMYGLKELVCRACPLIFDRGMSTLIKSSPYLQLLDLSRCGSITRATLDVAKKTCDNRSNNIMLKVIIGGTKLSFFPEEINGNNLSPFLQIVNVDLCDNYEFEH